MPCSCLRLLSNLEDDGIDACASLNLLEGITLGEERYRRTYSVYIANLGSQFDGLQQIMSAFEGTNFVRFIQQTKSSIR